MGWQRLHAAGRGLCSALVTDEAHGPPAPRPCCGSQPPEAQGESLRAQVVGHGHAMPPRSWQPSASHMHRHGPAPSPMVPAATSPCLPQPRAGASVGPRGSGPLSQTQRNTSVPTALRYNESIMPYCGGFCSQLPRVSSHSPPDCSNLTYLQERNRRLTATFPWDKPAVWDGAGPAPKRRESGGPRRLSPQAGPPGGHAHSSL